MLTFPDPVVEQHFAASHSRDSLQVSALHHLVTIPSWMAWIRSSVQLPGLRGAGVTVGLLMIVLQPGIAGCLLLDSKAYLRHEKVKCWCFILEAIGYMVFVSLLNPRKTQTNMTLFPAVLHVVSSCFDQVRLEYMVPLCACNTLSFAVCQGQAFMAKLPVHSWSAVIRETCLFALVGCALPLAICWQGERRKRQAFLDKHRAELQDRGFRFEGAAGPAR